MDRDEQIARIIRRAVDEIVELIDDATMEDATEAKPDVAQGQLFDVSDYDRPPTD